MLALLDHLKLSVFHIVLLVLRNITPGPWILKPVASGVRWARVNPLFHKEIKLTSVSEPLLVLALQQEPKV